MPDAWMTNDEARLQEALADVAGMQDPALLEKIVHKAPLKAVRLAALEKIVDKDTLTRMGKTAKGAGVRARAYEKAGEALLAKVEHLKACHPYDDWRARWEALKAELTDVKLLRDIIDHAQTYEVRELAVGNITDAAQLATLAEGQGYWGVRRAALEALGDEQAALALSARLGGNNLVRGDAIARLEDTALLGEIREKDKDEHMRRAAKRRLHFLATGQEDYTFPVERELPGLVCEEAYDDVSFGQEEARVAVCRDGKLGFANLDGRLVIPCVYDGGHALNSSNYYFREGIAAVEKAGLWGGINQEGNTVVPFEYDWCFSFHEGLAAVGKDGLHGYINAGGKVVIPLQYARAQPFAEGKAVVEKDGTEYVIDKSGRVLFALEGCATEYTPRYLGGYLRVGREVGQADKNGNRKLLFGLLDAEGKVAVPLEYDELDNYFVEDVRPAAKGENWGAVDNTGKTVIPFVYDRVWHYDAGVALVRKNERYGVYDEAGQLLIPVEYQDLYYPEDGAIPAKRGEKWGLIDLAQRPILPMEYDCMGVFYKKRAVICRSGKWGCITPRGEVVIPLLYDEVEGFELTSSTMVRQNGKYGCLGANGEALFPILYDEVCWPMQGVAIVRVDCDLMVVDSAGRVVYPHPIDTYRALDEKRCWINVHGKWRMLCAPDEGEL